MEIWSSRQLQLSESDIQILELRPLPSMDFFEHSSDVIHALWIANTLRCQLLSDGFYCSLGIFVC